MLVLKLAASVVRLHRELHNDIVADNYTEPGGRASDIGLLVALVGFYAAMLATIAELTFAALVSGFEPKLAIATTCATISLLGLCFAIMKRASPHRD
jgi:hypothetical protein